jgi:hypothetical protein
MNQISPHATNGATRTLAAMARPILRGFPRACLASAVAASPMHCIARARKTETSSLTKGGKGAFKSAQSMEDWSDHPSELRIEAHGMSPSDGGLL